MNRFTFKVVEGAELRERLHRLRFEIYTRECRFIREEECPEGKEVDKFDEYSLHFAAVDNQGKIAGAVRLVLDSPHGFPLEERCHYPALSHQVEVHRKHIAEVSRLVIDRQYRIGNWEEAYVTFLKDGHLQPEPQKLNCQITPILFGLYRLAFRESVRRGITHWIAAMEDSLSRLVNAHGFIFSPLGEPIDYFGKVTPLLGSLEEISRNVPADTMNFECTLS